MLVCFLLKRTSGHLNSKGFLGVLMTRATKKEQATTSLKTNSMNVNHVEYKQGFKNDLERNLSQVSTAATCWNSENGFCRSCMEYFNLRIAKYGWRNVEVGCCENRSQTYTQLMKRQSQSQSSSSLSITVRRFFSFWTILGWKLEIVAGLYSFPWVPARFSVHNKFQ